MIRLTRLARTQLLAFFIVTVVITTYGAFNFLGAGRLFSPGYEIEVQFANAGGIYPRANVELLGTRIGSVAELRAGPGRGTTVVLSIDGGVEVPADVAAAIGTKTAIGEQYVELTPGSAGAPYLADGDVIPVDRTQSPVATADLLRNIQQLVSSIDPKKLQRSLDEASLALAGSGDDAGTISHATLQSVDEISSLIDNASTVLETQVDLAPETRTLLGSLADVADRLRVLNPDIDQLIVQGIRAGSEVSGLIDDNASALPLLLDDLLTLTDTVGNRLPAVRKTLVMVPWILEAVPGAFRYCDEIDPDTGKKLEKSCHYDDKGRPFYSVYLAVQPPELNPSAPYYPCTQGYEGTKKYYPDGRPVDGRGARQGKDPAANLDAHCTSSPQDPAMPNVRGSQNIVDATPDPAKRSGLEGMAVYDPNTRSLAAPDGRTYRTDQGAPPARNQLSWLLTRAMEGSK